MDGLEVSVCDLDDTYLTQEISNGMEDLDITSIDGKSCKEDMIEIIEKGKAVFGILIPEGFTKDIEDLKSGHIEVYYDNTEPSITTLSEWRIDAALIPFKNSLVESLADEIKGKSGSAKDKTTFAIEMIDIADTKITAELRKSIVSVDDDLKRLSELDKKFLTSPVDTSKKGIHENLDIIDTGIVPLFVVLNLFVLMMICSTGVMYDKKVGIIKRIRASNSTFFSYMISKMIFFFMITLAEFIILTLIFLMFGATYSINLSTLIVALLFISLVNTALGILVGLISDTEGVAVLISLIITLPMMFLSGMFYPMQLMPKVFRLLAEIIPIREEIFMLKSGLLIGGEIETLYFLIPLGLMGIILWIQKKIR
jgi:hypothetical protein